MAWLRPRGLCCWREWLQAVQLVHRQDQSTLCGEGDHTLCRIRRQRLAALIVEDVPLRAADASTQGKLGQAQAFADGFDRAHAAILAALVHTVNRCASCASH